MVGKIVGEVEAEGISVGLIESNDVGYVVVGDSDGKADGLMEGFLLATLRVELTD